MRARIPRSLPLTITYRPRNQGDLRELRIGRPGSGGGDQGAAHITLPAPTKREIRGVAPESRRREPRGRNWRGYERGRDDAAEHDGERRLRRGGGGSRRGGERERESEGERERDGRGTVGENGKSLGKPEKAKSVPYL